MPDPTQGNAPHAAPALEIAHVLFMDIVQYSKLPIDKQSQLLRDLQNIIRAAPEFCRARKKDQLLRLPTGDGMALVFFGDPEAPARCALEVARAMHQHPELKVRMGIHTGPVYRVEDINTNRNVAGGGINIAQRVMDCGDAAHILVSKSVADVIGEVARWKDTLHDLGEAEVKHGVRVHVFNLYTPELGNAILPEKLRRATKHQQIRKVEILAALVFLVMVLALAAKLSHWSIIRNSRGNDHKATTVAVLPFGNLGSDKEIDYLRLALPDEIATALSRIHSLSIRPFATTSKYSSADINLEEAAREMRVDDIITGHFLNTGSQVQVTVEAIATDRNQTVWRDTLSLPIQSMITTRNQVLSRVRDDLVPILRFSADASQPGTQPGNEEAYDLFLHSTAIPNEPVTNKEAIRILEKAVGLDPSYAPAWNALGLRYYFDYFYSDGGQLAFERSNAALERARTLDPDFIAPLEELVIHRADRGELKQAYEDALALLKRAPDSGLAHFSMAYVLRYAGLLKESERECDTAVALDPGNYQFRSCATAFSLDGNPERAMEYLALDMGSSWSQRVEIEVLLRQGKRMQALEKARQPLGDFRGPFIQACLEQRPAAEIEPLSKKAREFPTTDPEDRYKEAELEAFCGRNQVALMLLDQGVKAGYCSYPAMDLDPLLVSLRRDAGFKAIRSAGIQCQKTFVANQHSR